MISKFKVMDKRSIPISVILPTTIFLTILLSMTSVSGLDKFYDSSNKAISLKDNGNDTAIYILLDNKASIIDVEAHGLALFFKPHALFDDVRFFDSKNNFISSNNEIYLIKPVTTNISTPNFVKVCSIDITNKSSSKCSIEKLPDIVSFKVTQQEVRYFGEVLPVGNYEWKIKSFRTANKPTEWIATALGVPLTEWAWWNTTWFNRREINITGSNSILSNFTIFVNVSFVQGMNVDFRDIRFVNGQCSGSQTQELSYENDYIVNSSSDGVWIKIPSLATGTNSICMYYNATGVTTNSNGINAFDNQYIIVMHFSEDTGNYLKNSKENNLTFLNLSLPNSNSPWISGVYGKAINLSRGHAITTGINNARPFINNSFTSEQWVNPHGIGAKVHLSKLSGFGSNNFGFDMGEGGTYSTGGCYWGSALFNFKGSYTEIANSWAGDSCVMVDIDAGAGMTLQRNKTSLAGAIEGAGAGLLYQGDYWSLGNDYATDGLYDEVRISNTTRSSSWINRSYDNANYSMFSFGDIMTNAQATTLNVFLLSPANNVNISVNFNSSTSINFISFSNGTETLVNATLSLYYSNGTLRNSTINNSFSNGNSSFFIASIVQGNYTWNVAINTYNISSNRTFMVYESASVVDHNLIYLDFSQTKNLVFFIVMLIIAFILILFRQFKYGGWIIFIMGLLIFFSGESVIFGILLMAIGGALLFARNEW